MSDFVPYLVLPVLCGVGAKFLRLPPMLGFLLSGIILNILGYEPVEAISKLGDLGVTLMLFTIGLKLDPRLLFRTEVWLTSAVHLVITTGCGASFILFLTALGLGVHEVIPLEQAAILGFALSFSSTVLVAKTLEERSETRSLYGRTALGILVVQDLFAVLFVAVSGEHSPTWWALGLVFLVPASWLFKKGLAQMGHGELLVLYGIVLAFVPGYWLFDMVGVKGDLGALVMGMLVASHPKSNELSRILFSLKELMLVGFFVSTGLAGVPSLSQSLFAFLLLFLLPINTVAYTAILRWAGLSPRTSVLTSLTLTNFSEFCIIVIAMSTSAGLLDSSWTITFSLAVSLSFVLGTILNMRGSSLPSRLAALVPPVPVHRRHPEERPVELGDVQAVIFGMGKIGRATYDDLVQNYQLPVAGVDTSELRVSALAEQGYNVIEADATDEKFWERVTDNPQVHLVILAMPVHGTNVDAMRHAIEAHSHCAFVAVSQYADEIKELKELGADTVVNLYDGAGSTLAEAGYKSFIEKFHPRTGSITTASSES
ncbi:cation:proton antiporter [Rothia sp. P6271]|uniref:cation:proton antiporter domain-containing protein n=1 Tax=unclassified Rothia (in: high G+C Gram-positive bacteria) TaxID=2689056 RepID=UPI003ACA4143